MNKFNGFIKKMIRVFLIVLSVAVLGVVGLYLYADNAPVLSKDYIKSIETGGEIENQYLQSGSYDTSRMTVKIDKPMKRYSIYYPSELDLTDRTYPLVFITNGTGGKATKYKPAYDRLASWGFVVVGNQDKGTGTGKSASLTLQYMLDENNNESSIFYQKIDTENIGITGFSQGGAAVMSAVTAYENSNFFKTAVSLSPLNEQTASGVGYPYDLTKIHIPIMMLAGTEGDFETEVVIPFEAMNNMYEKVIAPKVMARRVGADHDMMVYSADGYVTAWLMWQLQGDENAAKAFVGEEPEIQNNILYQGAKINLNDHTKESSSSFK